MRGVFYDLINVLGHFSVFLQPQDFGKAEFTYISSARKAARKITKILRSFCVQLEFESFKSVKNSWCYESSKVGPFFWLTRYILQLTRNQSVLMMMRHRRCNRSEDSNISTLKLVSVFIDLENEKL